jgi:hypothetical protein
VSALALLDLKELRGGVVAPLVNAHCERNHFAPRLLREPNLTLNKDSPTQFHVVPTLCNRSAGLLAGFARFTGSLTVWFNPFKVGLPGRSAVALTLRSFICRTVMTFLEHSVFWITVRKLLLTYV